MISVIILNWNGLNELRPCLAAVAENTLIDDYEVIVLDNDSEEPGVEDVVRPYPKARLIKSKRSRKIISGACKRPETGLRSFV